jgi:hypothetical protein
MPPALTTVPALDAAAFECMHRFDDVRAATAVVNVHAMSRAATARDFDHLTRASAYVWVAAALEEFVKRFLEGLVSEINAAAVPQNELKESLLTLTNARSFESLGSLVHPRDLKKWARQVDLLQSVQSPDVSPLSLDQDHWPIDGATLHKDHLEAIWSVFGLKPDVVPSSRTYGFLTDLRENRTRAAHGEESAVQLGRQQSFQDVIDLIDRGEELVSHMLDRGTSYLLNLDYRR